VRLDWLERQIAAVERETAEAAEVAEQRIRGSGLPTRPGPHDPATASSWTIPLAP
jgi:hypothetical protein